jgi:hypothetical protein
MSLLFLATIFSLHLKVSESKDPLEVTLETTQGENVTLETEGLGERLTTSLFYGPPPFELIKEEKNKFTLKPLIEGKHPLTFYEVSLISKEGSKITLASPLVFVDIPSKQSNQLKSLVLIALPLIYILVATLLLTYFYRPPPLTQEEIKKLSLKRLNLIYVETSSKTLVQSIVKVLKDFFGISNTKTTEEISHLIQNKPLIEVLKTSDLVRFSHLELSKEEKEDLMKRVKSSVLKDV